MLLGTLGLPKYKHNDITVAGGVVCSSIGVVYGSATTQSPVYISSTGVSAEGYHGSWGWGFDTADSEDYGFA